MKHNEGCSRNQYRVHDYPFTFTFTFTFQVYQCADKKCITAEQVCDLINDCGHWEEEEKCINHFKCSSAPLKLIRHEQVGIQDTSTLHRNTYSYRTSPIQIDLSAKFFKAIQSSKLRETTYTPHYTQDYNTIHICIVLQ